MSKANDNWFKNRQKDIDDLIKQLQELYKIPLGRRALLSSVELNGALQKLAFYVRNNNEVIEIDRETNRRAAEHLGFITDLVFPLHNQVISLNHALSSLTDEVRSLKGKADQSKLDGIEKELERIEKKLRQQEQFFVLIKKAKENKEKWMGDNR